MLESIISNLTKMQKIKNIINKHPNILAALLLGVMAVAAITSMRTDSAIVDEIAHIPAGYSYLKYNDYRLNVEHPPLIKDLAGAPLQFMNLKFPTELFAWKNDVNGQWESGWHFIYHIGNNANNIIFWSRIPMVLVMLLLGFYVFKAAKDWFGEKEALLALTLFTLSPNIIAHGRFVTTDVGAATFIFISIYYFLKWIKKPTKKNVLKATIALALAQLAKFSAVLLIPLFLFAVAVYISALWLKKKNRSFKDLVQLKLKYGGELLIIFVSAFILIGIFYWPHVKNMPVEKMHAQIEVGFPSEKVTMVRNTLNKMADIPILRPHAYYLTGFGMVIGRVAGGNTTYFLGKVTNQSFRAYFPVVYLAKTPLATLILVATAIIMLLFSILSVSVKNIKNTIASTAKFAKKHIIWVTIPILIIGYYIFIAKGFANVGLNILLKSIIPLLILTFIAVSYGAQYIKDHIVEITSLFFIFIYAYSSITGNLNIGFRHLIPILPFIFILTSYEIMKLIGKNKKMEFLGGILTLLIIWLIGANMFIYPNYVAYFNEAVGGPKNGHKIVTDSNVDWGQDLERLKTWTDENNIENIKIDYFGGGNPRYYFCERAIDPINIGPESLSENEAYDCSNSIYEPWHANDGKTTGWIAVSATFLQNSLWYKQQFGEKDYQWLRERTPKAMIGYSILVYNIEE